MTDRDTKIVIAALTRAATSGRSALALRDDPAEVAAILATVPEVDPGRVDWLRDPDAFVDDDGREGSRGDDTC